MHPLAPLLSPCAELAVTEASEIATLQEWESPWCARSTFLPWQTFIAWRNAGRLECVKAHQGLTFWGLTGAGRAALEAVA